MKESLVKPHVIQDEILLGEDECCIIFDFACYFPYMDELTFDFCLGSLEFPDKVLNHRYKNKNYHTITKTYGRKHSKIGYPHIMKLDDQHVSILIVKVGLKDKWCSTLSFPLTTAMTKENPCCHLSLKFIFDEEPMFFFESTEKMGNEDRWILHRWMSCEEILEKHFDNDVILTPDVVDTEHYVLVYNEPITPYPVSITDVPRLLP